MKALKTYISEGLFGGSSHVQPRDIDLKFNDLQVGDTLFEYSYLDGKVCQTKVVKVDKSSRSVNIKTKAGIGASRNFKVPIGVADNSNIHLDYVSVLVAGSRQVDITREEFDQSFKNKIGQMISFVCVKEEDAEYITKTLGL